MTPSSNLATLSSKNPGGVPGAVSITTTGGVNLSIDGATSTVQPPGDGSTTIWTPTYTLSGLGSVTDTSATTPLASAGTGSIAVNLTATKAGSSTFTPGSYGATVTVRCEP